MKKSLILFLPVLLVKSYAFSQAWVYHPFPDSGAVWRMVNVEYCFITPPPQGQCNSDYQYILKGDTLINGFKYTKVLHQGYYSSCSFSPPNNWTCTTPYYSSYFYGGYRNDSIAKKVFWWDGFNGEVLLYDFSLNVGDTMRGLCNLHVISSIDSVLIGSDYRKRFVLDNSNCVIEGLGSVWNLWGNSSFADPFLGWCGDPCVCNSGWNFLCFSQNGVTLFPDTSTCTIINNIYEPLPPEQVSIYPNPSSSQFTITSPFVIDQIQIADPTGVIIERSFPKERFVSLNLRQSGIYFVTLKLNNQVVTRKIIVQKP